MFEKPENTVDFSKCLANLSQQEYVKVPHSCHDWGKELSSLLQNANCSLAGKQFTLNKVFQNLSVFPYLSIVNADI